jgi:hypothetical protein
MRLSLVTSPQGRSLGYSTAFIHVDSCSGNVIPLPGTELLHPSLSSKNNVFALAGARTLLISLITWI